MGSRAYALGYEEEGVARGQAPAAIASPAATVMFTDAAYIDRTSGQSALIEYSFAEA